ncbi:MAG: patatin-like phospholipase family protein [Betaproteobacteria bacterium]|nr:patatin-like phospholipase family protein [Betaproteobacteria bacterium]
MRRMLGIGLGLGVLALMGAGFSEYSHAQSGAQAKRPRIGLALGGGGARGAAHIGVLEVLEEMRIPVDCVVGTSMGALVGGAYAAGRSPAAMAERVGQTDWTDIFIDEPDRADVKLRKKQLDDQTFPGLEIGVGSGSAAFRSGAVAGDKIKFFINGLVGADRGQRLIESLAVPTRIIATDIATGAKVVLKDGSLSQAMRASMSVPGLMVPVIIDNKKLVDGGLVDNVPVVEARKLCADIVIAVDVGTPLLKSEEIAGVLSVAVQMINILTNQNVEASFAALNKSDLLIRPDLGTVTAADFNRHAEAIEAGRKAARAVAAKLAPLALTRIEYDYQMAHLRTRQPPPVTIDAIEVAKLGRVNTEVVRKHLDVPLSEPLDAARLNKSLVRLNGEGDFQSVDYAIDNVGGRRVLRINPVEKSWGPDYLRFGINFSTDFNNNAPYNLRAVYHRTWMNPLGAEWLTTLQLGEREVIATEWYQPLDKPQRWYVKPAASFVQSSRGLYVEGSRVSEFEVQDRRMAVEVGYNLGMPGQLRLGWLERSLKAETVTGLALFEAQRARSGGPYLGFEYDTLDERYFPSRGLFLNANIRDVRRVDREDAPYARASLELWKAWSLRDYTLQLTAEMGSTTRGVLPAYDAFTLGGPFRLSGFASDQLVGDDMRFARLALQRRLLAPSGIVGASVYAGVLAEAGKMGLPYTEARLTGWQKSFGVYLGMNTIVGPLYFGYSNAPKGRSTWYLFLGTP